MAIPTVIMGLGTIGREIARAALAKPGLSVVAAVDLDPSRTGRPLGDVLGGPAPDVVVTRSAPEAFARAKGGVVLHATGSRFLAVRDQLLAACEAGLSVVSTCEELAFPWLKHPDEADALDQAAEKAGVAILGTGVNPGFVLDRLPVTLGAVCRVDAVRALRVVDVSTRRAELWRKVGVGLSLDAFEEAVDEGRLGHVGLSESAALCALGVGHEPDDVEEEIDAVVADENAPAVQKGQVAGVIQVARAYSGGRLVAELELTIAYGAERPRDEIRIEGTPPIHLVIEGGVAGEPATAWAVAHAAPLLRESGAGLLTVLDLPAGR